MKQAELVMHLTVDGAALWIERVILALGLVVLVLSYRIDRLQGRPGWIIAGTLLFAAGVALAFVDIRASFVVGLLPTLPLTPLGMVYPRPSREEERQPHRVVFDLLMTVNVGFLLLGLAMVTHSPGQCWGPRFLSAVFPLLAILAWRTFHAVNLVQRRGLARQAVQASFVALALLSVVVQCIGVSMQYHHKREMQEVYRATAALEPQYVLTDHWVYPQYVAGLYFSKTFLRVTTQQGYDTLVGRLYDHGVRQFVWLPNTPDAIDPTIDTAVFSIRRLVEPVYAFVPNE
jgi:MFS family permease